jgi:two-component system, OmpR family, sensor histidine kinase PrrB
VRRLVRSPSLRTRVALAAATAAAAVVAVFTILTSVVLANNDALQLDRRLDSIVEASMFPEQLSDPRQGVLTTGRMESTGQVVFQRGLQLPPLQPGTADVVVNGVDYRVRTIPVEQQGGVLMSIGIRADSILLSRARIPFYVAVGLVTVLIAAGVGWLLSGPAIRPLRRLTEHTRRLGKGTEEMPKVRGVREAEQLSEAMTGMLSRLAAAQLATQSSLQAAQDFAANAAHELRTPLTAMRADLDTLRIHDLPEEERAEVVNDLSRAQRRVERVARENMRPGGPVEVTVEADDDVGTIWGWPSGLRLAVDNLVRNAVAHGPATRITLSARRTDDRITIIVDDNGRGIPADEHTKVLGRFTRGSTAAAGGSGLGLALVAQQAALHDGTIELSDSPLGGLRATLTVSAAEPQPDRDQR